MPFKNQHPLYTVWHSMIERCRNPRSKAWTDYGGRGINVCENWKQPKGEGFRAFLQDMGDRPEGYVIDRINNDAGYSPENCQWVSRKQSQRNRRVTLKVIIEGQEYIAAEIAEKAGMKIDTIVARAKHGLTMEQILDPSKRIFYEGLKVGWKYGRGGAKK